MIKSEAHIGTQIALGALFGVVAGGITALIATTIHRQVATAAVRAASKS